jgi:hypothetical protein
MSEQVNEANASINTDPPLTKIQETKNSTAEPTDTENPYQEVTKSMYDYSKADLTNVEKTKIALESFINLYQAMGERLQEFSMHHEKILEENVDLHI